MVDDFCGLLYLLWVDMIMCLTGEFVGFVYFATLATEIAGRFYL